MKVRGTAQHVAEKYLQLARDAQSSGDTVAAESYFQHAEHYYRILLAAQEQMTQQFGHTFPPNRAFVEDEDGEEEGEDDGQGYQPGGEGQPRQQQHDGFNGHPQPYGQGGQRQEGQRQEGEGGQRFDRQNRNDRQDRGDRQDRNRRFDRQDRGERRFEGGQSGYAPRQDGAPRSEGPAQDPASAQQPPQAVPAEAGETNAGPQEQRFERPRSERRPRRERIEENRGQAAESEDVGGLPSFLTSPLRVPITVAEKAPSPAAEAPAAAEPAAAPAGGETPAEPVKRPRRRRSPREVMAALEAEGETPAE